MDKKYTPAPWKHVPDDSGFMSFDGPNEECIIGGCGCCQSPFGNSEDSGHTWYNPNEADKANAKLIESAPELLEALQHCLEILEYCTIHPKLIPTYGNAVMNYTNLIQRATNTANTNI